MLLLECLLIAGANNTDVGIAVGVLVAFLLLILLPLLPVLCIAIVLRCRKKGKYRVQHAYVQCIYVYDVKKACDICNCIVK